MRGTFLTAVIILALSARPSAGEGDRSAEPGFGYPEFRAYLEQSLAQNKRWDVLARELLVPGDGAAQGASYFLASRLKGSKKDRVDARTVAVASTFFGVRLECARCHDHPYVEEWKQEHYLLPGRLPALSREPTKDQAAEVEAYLKTPDVPRAQLCREVAWALLAGAEVRFNH